MTFSLKKIQYNRPKSLIILNRVEMSTGWNRDKGRLESNTRPDAMEERIWSVGEEKRIYEYRRED